MTSWYMGGKAILQGGGELGTLLFQAGGGLKNLLEVQRELTKQIEDLFKPGGSKPRINVGLSAFKEANETQAGGLVTQHRVGSARRGSVQDRGPTGGR